MNNNDSYGGAKWWLIDPFIGRLCGFLSGERMGNFFFDGLLGAQRMEKLIGVPLQRRPAGDRELHLRDGFAIAKGLVDAHQSGGFEAARVGAEIAVGQTGAASQMHEFHALFDGQCGQDLQPTTAGNQRVELLDRGHKLFIGLLNNEPSHKLIS
jgi:hypothetical protein